VALRADLDIAFGDRRRQALRARWLQCCVRSLPIDVDDAELGGSIVHRHASEQRSKTGAAADDENGKTLQR
jgi:hypothetical protein